MWVPVLKRLIPISLLVWLLSSPASAHVFDEVPESRSRLLLTGGVSSLEGAGGGGRATCVSPSVCALKCVGATVGRTRPDHRVFATEDDAFDAYAASAFNNNVSVTAAFVDLGSMPTFGGQRDRYLWLQFGFS